MAEVVDFAIGHPGPAGSQRLFGLPRKLHREHPVERAVRHVYRQAVQSLLVGRFDEEGMERRRHRRQVGEWRAGSSPLT